jgi:heme-degrading monooxygenase HmoA
MIDVKTRFIAVSTYHVAEENFATVTEAATRLMQREIPELAGFCEGAVIVDEAKTRMLLVTQWSSKHDWAQAFWEPRIGDAVAAWVEDATKYEVQTFEPLTIVRR